MDIMVFILPQSWPGRDAPQRCQGHAASDACRSLAPSGAAGGCQAQLEEAAGSARQGHTHRQRAGPTEVYGWFLDDSWYSWMVFMDA